MPKTSTSFKPGNNANPNGRPKKDWTMAALIREAGNEADETGVPKSKIIARKLADLAAKGDMQAIKEFNQRMDGMPQQNLGIGDMEGNKLEIVIKEEKILSSEDE